MSITFVRVKLVNDYYHGAKYIPYKVVNDKTLCILHLAGRDVTVEQFPHVYAISK